MNEKYESIIALPHPEPQNHARMSKESRAAQFAPYSALSGYEGAIEETGRRTDKKIELDESEKEIINARLLLAAEEAENMRVKITYFVPDGRKSGGAYLSVCGSIGLTDEIKREITLTNGRIIPIDEIIAVEEDENEPQE